MTASALKVLFFQITLVLRNVIPVSRKEASVKLASL